jgi:hypothetical protein
MRFNDCDWHLLREQKNWLMNQEINEYQQGLLGLIDWLQDEAAKELGSCVVFGNALYEPDDFIQFDFKNYESYLNPLSEEFIERNKDLVNWYWISEYQKLSEEFIERNKDLVNWRLISEYQKPSEEFIERNKDLVDWINISVYQNLSEEFIEQNKDLVNWRCISEYQKLSEEFRLKHNLN